MAGSTTDAITDTVCAFCGFHSPAGFAFCGRCGARLAASGVERRQLTIMFCDIVNSTQLFARVDPEDEREIVQRYRQLCERYVSRFGGSITKFIGDGIQACFGYPRAHDRDAAMAVRAALAMVEEIQSLGSEIRQRHGIDLSIRIAIHTGLVVAGEMGAGDAREASFAGGVHNIAARLQEFAEPNNVVITTDTYRLVRDFFVCRELPPRLAKGLSAPLLAWRVLEPHPPTLRGGLPQRRALPALVDRETELAPMLHCWRKVAAGSGEIVLLTGEPGIGKSRLIRAVRAGLDPSAHRQIVIYCSEHTLHSAFSPVIEHLRRFFGLSEDDRPEEKLAKLQARIDVFAGAPAEALPLIAALLDIPTPQHHALSELSVEARKRRTIEILVSTLTKTGRGQGVLFVVEDLHWADASTLALIHLLETKLDTMPVMVVLSARPEFHLPARDGRPLTHINLDRLSPAHAKTIVTNLAHGETLASDLLERLVERADGVPLFVEELTRMALDTGGLDTALGTASAPEEPAIPATLHGPLMARLDRLGSAKTAAQIAAVLGRTFSFDLLRVVCNCDHEQLQADLAELVASEIVLRLGEAWRGRFAFKHALIRDVAYHSLLRARRKELHRNVANALCEQFADRATSTPELVAQHYAAAGLLGDAVTHWRIAGLRAIERSSNTEAMAHLGSAIAALGQLPPAPERDATEVGLQIALGTAATAAVGYAAPATEMAFARARDLCTGPIDAPLRFSALRGLQSFHIVRGPLTTAHSIGRQLLLLAKQRGEPFLLTEAHRAFGWSMFCAGRMRSGRQHLRFAAKLYDPACALRHIDSLGTDAGVMAMANLAWVNWFLGDYTAAIADANRAIVHARSLGHAHSLAYGLCVAAALYQGLRRPARTRELAEMTIGLAEKHDFAYWTAWGSILRGWALAELGRLDEGLAALKRGLALYRATGAELFRSHALCLIAEICRMQGNVNEGIALLDEGVASGRKSDVHFYDAELFRVYGELLAAAGKGNAAAVAFRRSLATASRQGARSLRLRAALAFHRSGRGAWTSPESRHALTEAYRALSPGFETADMIAAKAALR